MKENVYKVPEGFFEQAEEKIMKRTELIRKRRRTALLLCPAVVALAFIFLWKPVTDSGKESTYLASAQDYSDKCDIFLEIFEY